MPRELPVFSLWTETLGGLLDAVGRFPRSVRPTFGARIAEQGLDVLERIVELRYTKERPALFREANLGLEKLRVLLRISFDRRLVSSRVYEHLAESIDRTGRMLGGWRRQEQQRGVTGS